MKRILIMLLVAAPLLSIAQSSLKKGYIVKNAGDTLKGYIKIRERNLNPASARFRLQTEDTEQVFGLKDCSAFSIEGLETYRRAIVKISLSTDVMGRLSSGLDTTSKTDTVFLKVLTEGKNATLFSYTDNIKTRFYIKDNGTDKINELIKNVYTHPGNGKLIINDNTFLKQLKELVEKYQGQSDNLSAIRYTERDLVKLISVINHADVLERRTKAVRFFAGVGLNITRGYYKGITDFTNDATTVKTSYLPLITCGIDLFANPDTKKLIYRAELSLLMSKNEISTTTNEDYKSALSHKFDQFTVALTPQVLYNFYNENYIKVFATAGATLNFSSYSNNVSTRINSFRNETYTTPNEVKIEQFNFAPQVTAGIVLKNKFELSAGYSFPSIISSFAAYNLYIKRYRIGINYFFGKN